MSDYIIECTRCKNKKHCYLSEFNKTNKQKYICKKCRNIQKIDNSSRICPKCLLKITHSNPQNRKRCEGRLCKKCKSNQIPTKFSKEQLSVFNGLMLGDGGLIYSRKNNALFPRLSVCRQLLDKEYLFWQYNLFKNFYGTEPKEYKVWHHKAKKYYKGYSCRTKTGKIFKEFHDKFYPKGIKIIPKDMKLTPLTLLIWFLDDGCVIHNKNSLTMKFSTDGFSKKDTVFIQKLLNSKIKSKNKFEMYKNGSGWILKGSTLPALEIIKIIDPIFISCMERKRTWKNFDFEYLKKNKKLFG